VVWNEAVKINGADPDFHRRDLDTQLKRLGSPNFTRLPVNAPRCPVAHFQQDGHMAMVNPQAGPTTNPAPETRPALAPADRYAGTGRAVTRPTGPATRVRLRREMVTATGSHGG
jgi:catalase